QVHGFGSPTQESLRLRYAGLFSKSCLGTTASRMASPQHEHPQPRSNRQLILAAQIAFLPTGILTTLLGPMLPILIARWALNDTQAGSLFLVQFLASLAGVQISGILLSRLGFRPAFLSGLLLMAAGVATLYLGSPGLGMVSVAVYGLGLGFIIPTDNLMIAEIAPGSRAAAVSLLNFYWGVGAVLCSLLVAWAHPAVPRGGQVRRSPDCVAKNLQGSHNMAVRLGILSLPRGGDRGGGLDWLVCGPHGIARGGHGTHDAGFFLVGTDVGPSLGKPDSKTPAGAARAAGGLCRGNGGDRPDAVFIDPAGRHCRRACYRIELRHLVSHYGCALLASLRSGRAEHWLGDVFLGVAGTGGVAVGGGCDFESHRQSACRPCRAVGSHGDLVADPHPRLVRVRRQTPTEWN